MDGGIRMIEFFSGVGGMRLGVQQACREMSSEEEGRHPSWQLISCVAYEIADNANQIYKHNFVETTNENGTSRLICQEIQRITCLPPANLWTLSPPCQPFCRKPGAKHLDMDDPRCQGLFGVIRLLEEKEISERPRWILLENVKGFATSRMLQVFQAALQRCGYTWKQYLLSPIQLGTPNHRMRFYLICEKSTRFLGAMDCINTTLPTEVKVEKETKRVSNYVDTAIEPAFSAKFKEVDSTRDFDRFSLHIPNSVLEKPWAKELHFAGPDDTATHCFTSSYGRIYHAASGSLFCAKKVASDTDCSTTGAEKECSLLEQYGHGLSRRFTPKEVANFLDFPSWFSFPPDLRLDHQYKHIANAVNVKVVAVLVQELVHINNSNAL